MVKEKLSNLYDIGSSKRVFQSEWREKGIPFYRAREIARLSEDGHVDNELFIDEDLYKEYTERYGKPQPGDVMVTGVGTLGVCYVVKPGDKFYFKDGNILWFKQKAPEKILPEYLVKAFESKEVKDFISKNSSGTTVGTFTIQTANRMEISLPSLEQQKEIIERISKLEGIIKKRQYELDKLDELIKARFVEMFGHGNHKIVKASDVCDFITKGTTPPTGEITEEYADGMIPFLKVYNLSFTGEMLFDDNPQFIPKETHNGKLARSKVYPDDVLMNIVGPPLGKFTIVTGEFKEWNINQAIAIFRAKDRILPRFLLHALMQPTVLEPFIGQAIGIRQQNLSLEQCRNLQFPLPSIEEQKAFVEFAEQLDKSKFGL